MVGFKDATHEIGKKPRFTSQFLPWDLQEEEIQNKTVPASVINGKIPCGPAFVAIEDVADPNPTSDPSVLLESIEALSPKDERLIRQQYGLRF